MKKLVTFILAFSVMLMAGNAFGQEVQKETEKAKTEKTAKEKKVKESEAGKADQKAIKAEEDEEGPQAKEGQNKNAATEKADKKQPGGNAYGKNKGDVKGKEFGQTQSTTAKQKSKTKKK